MIFQGIVHKKSEEDWTVEQQDGTELAILASDITTMYKEMKTCGKDTCGCWILKEGLIVEYQKVEQNETSYANII